MNNFDIKKFLIENKLTSNSRLLKEVNIPSQVAQDERYQNRPPLTEFNVEDAIYDYLDTFNVDYFVQDSYDDDYAQPTSPIGYPDEWKKEDGYGYAPDVVEYFLKKKYSSWLDDLNDEVGEQIYETYVQEFAEIASKVNFDLIRYLKDRFD
jgi:hypothetical protein